MRPLVAMLPVAVLAAACGGPMASASIDATETIPVAAAVDGSWVLVSGGGPDGAIPLVDDHPVTLTIAGTQLSGRAACNGYGARLVFRGGRPAIGGVGQDLVLCPEPVMAVERAYVDALPAVDAIRLDGDQLVLNGPGVELRFAALPEPPTDELVDRVWVLETLFVGDVASAPDGDPAILELRSDGSVAGTTGCRSFEGTWIEAGEQIVITSMSMEDESCPEAFRAQDSSVVSVVGDGFVPTIDDQLLTLVDPGSIGLVYRAAVGG